MIIPVKRCVWGPIDSVETLRQYVAKSGQFFGVDQSGPACEFNPIYPCDQSLYSYMGWGVHKGIDIPCSTGTEVFAAHQGKVIKLSDSLTAGIGIVLESLDEEIRTVYWHLKEYSLTIGDVVNEGQKIALSDNTGFSKGPHLHWEIKVWDGTDYKPVDPILYLQNMQLTKKQVIMLQVLEGYSDPEGVEYWTNKELEQYLTARLPDKIAALQRALSEKDV